MRIYCQAYGKLCSKCHKKNHFALVCRAKEWEGKQDCKAMTTREECYWEDSHSHDDSLLMSGPIRVDRRGKRLLVELEHEKKLVTCQLDTAAARNIVCLKDYYRWGQPKLEPSSVTLVTYDGTEMKSKGKTTVNFKRVEKPITFEVIDTKVEQRPPIGIDTCLDLGPSDYIFCFNFTISRTIHIHIGAKGSRTISHTHWCQGL